jgi:hypothetical protein
MKRWHSLTSAPLKAMATRRMVLGHCGGARHGRLPEQSGIKRRGPASSGVMWQDSAMTTHTITPVWSDPSQPSRARVAHWLYTQVKKGNTFTKADLRAAIAGVEQVDRRMRELRGHGWVIKTYREMSSLNPNELYLDTIGTRVWESA